MDETKAERSGSAADTQVRARVLDVGDVVLDRYEIVGALGVGGMAKVYRVVQVHLRKEMALKILEPKVAASPDLAERFVREAKVVSQLDHPGIVRVNDFGRSEDGMLCLVMDLVPGRSLKQVLRDGPLPSKTAIDIAQQILEAVGAAHAAGVVHRDLKPANIMIDEGSDGPTVRLLDFGLARVLAPEEGDPTLTRLGMVLGTPKYESPEQARGEPAGPSADIYATGLVLYECLSGTSPYSAKGAENWERAHREDAPAPLPASVSDSQIEAIIQKALAKRPDDRFASAEAFLAALKTYAKGLADTRLTSSPLPAERALPPAVASSTGSGVPPPSNTTRSVVRQNRWPLVAAGLAAAALTAGLLVPRFFASNERAELLRHLEMGELAQARVLADSLLRDEGDDGEVLLLSSRVAFARGETELGLRHFEHALLVEPNVATNPDVRARLASVMDEDPGALASVLRELGRSKTQTGSDLLLELHASSPNAASRRVIVEALEPSTDEAWAPVLPAMIQDLADVHVRNCEERRWYVERLVKTGHSKAAEAVEAERDRRGVFGQDFNDCMRDLFDASE